jgi:methyl-accepting chemotaxis protein
VGTGIDLTDFINALYTGMYGSGFQELYLFNGQGAITGAQDSSLMEAKVTLAHHWEEDGKTVEVAAKQLSGGEVRTMTLGGAEYAVGALPQLNWYIAARERLEAAMILQSPMAIFFMAILLTVLFLFVVINFYIFRLTSPLNKSVLILGEIAAAWDFTRRLDARDHDETGRLAEIFNITFEKIQSLVIETIDTHVRTVAEQETGIRNAMEEQESGNRQILEAINRLRELSAVVHREAEGIAREGQDAILESKSLEQITAQIESGMSEVSNGTEMINSVVNRISEISGGNKNSIDTLNGEVLKFKV